MSLSNYLLLGRAGKEKEIRKIQKRIQLNVCLGNKVHKMIRKGYHPGLLPTGREESFDYFQSMNLFRERAITLHRLS